MTQVQEVILWLGDLIKNISWQHVVLILVLVCRNSLKSLGETTKVMAGRFSKVKVGSFEVEARQQEITEKLEVSIMKESLNRPRIFKTMEFVEKLLRENLAKQNISNEDKNNILITDLAETRLAYSFGIIYAQIFGSQIRGLIELSARRKVSAQEAFEFFKQFADRYPDFYAEYGFEGWRGFLINREFVKATGDEIHITDLGDDFVTWLKVTGLSSLSRDKPW